MELPQELKIAIEDIISNINHKNLIANSESITQKYKNESGLGKHLITSNEEAGTYSVVRMPATFGAVYSALKFTMEFYNEEINSLIDFGAGTGAVSWACSELLDFKEITCLEREDAMISIGNSLMKKSKGPLNKAKWVKYDLTRDNFNKKADLVVSSYVLNELSSENRLNAIDKMWQSANKLLIILEPGTPTGSSNLIKARDYLLEKGAHIVAPCPHENPCVAKDEWCHFSCRIPRSKIHREIKKADAAYEDEKFSYIAVTKKHTEKPEARILRHPIIKKGRIQLEVCTKDEIKKVELYKKHGELYKKARKSNWGDAVCITPKDI